jgi:hypothetical protein
MSWFSSSNFTLTSVSGGGLTWAVDKQNNANGGYCTGIASAQAPSGLSASTVLTATMSGGSIIASMKAYYITGAATSTPVDATGSGGASGTSSSVNVVTTNADDIIVYETWNDINGDITPTTGFTEIYDLLYVPDDIQCENGYRVVSATGTYGAGGTWTGSKNWTTSAVAYKAAAGGGAAFVADGPLVFGQDATTVRSFYW